MDPAQLKEILVLMREQGVLELKMNGLEIKLAPPSPGPKPPPMDDKDALKKLEALKPLMALSNEQIMDQMFPATPIGGSDDAVHPG